MNPALVERLAWAVERRLSRRSVLVRSAFVGSALTVGGIDFALRPATAYGYICRCADPGCGCGSTCCDGYTQFCCTINGGYNWCPEGSVIGGWWKADGSTFCSGPRYYMDCNAVCSCTTGCGNGWPFCDPSCDGLTCECALGDCNNWATGCFQFRYGQCNQDIACLGRIQCRVVSCVPPWQIDSTCTTTSATDDATAQMNAPCNTAVPAPPPPPCDSPATQCEVVGMAATPDGMGYAMVTAFGKVLTYGDSAFDGDAQQIHLARPIVGMAATPSGQGYWLVAADGGVFAFGDAPFLGSMGGHVLAQPVVGMAAAPHPAGATASGSPTGASNTTAASPTGPGSGYWLVAADGGVFAFGDALFLGSMGGHVLDRPVVAMAATPSGQGYWLVAADGGVFAFGDAGFFGSPA